VVCVEHNLATLGFRDRSGAAARVAPHRRRRRSGCVANASNPERRDAETGSGDEGEELEPLELDPKVIVARGQGRQGWLREARRQLDGRRPSSARSIELGVVIGAMEVTLGGCRARV
jgi:hypothetical protein